jgi:hypothetical protein
MSYCIHLMMRISKHRTEHYRKSQVLDKFLGKKDVPVPMRYRARNFLEVSWERYGSNNEVALLPPSILPALGLSFCFSLL